MLNWWRQEKESGAASGGADFPVAVLGQPLEPPAGDVDMVFDGALPATGSVVVTWHKKWGQVAGEVYDDIEDARHRFHQMVGGIYAAMLIRDGREVAYYGKREGREREMHKWLANEVRWQAAHENERTGGGEPLSVKNTFLSFDDAEEPGNSAARCSTSMPPTARFSFDGDQGQQEVGSGYVVTWHKAWGRVMGELYRDEKHARARFRQLEGGLYAAMLVSETGSEVAYYGKREAVEVEMKRWCEQQVLLHGQCDAGSSNSVSPARSCTTSDPGCPGPPDGTTRGAAPAPGLTVMAQPPLEREPVDSDGLNATLRRLLGRKPAGQTTVMVRNIPNKFTQRSFLQVLIDIGYGGTMDLFYLPIDWRTFTNLGYAFLNFTTEVHAREFREQMEGYRLGSKSQKLLATSIARVQGFNANFESLRKNVVMASEDRLERQPIIFDPDTGAEIPFPPPAGPLKRTRKKAFMDFNSSYKRLFARVCLIVQPHVAHPVTQYVLDSHKVKRFWKPLEQLIRGVEESDATLASVVSCTVAQMSNCCFAYPDVGYLDPAGIW
mmetsp:Transcript_48681/g.128772  ORF Transcript_48681/g.128772 Transcript_48681/m.128772 type:complete len:551 (-) Transcript_48681:108-1760(-)